MKRYKLLKDLPLAKAGTIFIMGGYELGETQRTGKFGEWFEEIEENKVWKPEEGGKYYCISCSGSVYLTRYFSDKIDRHLFEIGNCFKTKEDAEKAVEKLRALRRLREAGLKVCDRMTWGSNNNIIIPVHVPKDGLDMAARDALFADLIKVCGVGEEDA